MLATLLAFSLIIAVKADEIVKPIPTDMPNQHTFVLMLSAKFSCGLKRWPADLNELKAFQEINEIELGVVPNWGWIFGEEFSFEKSKNKMDLVSVSIAPEGNPITVKSYQEKPLCENGSITIRGAHVDIDFGEEDS